MDEWTQSGIHNLLLAAGMVVLYAWLQRLGRQYVDRRREAKPRGRWEGFPDGRRTRAFSRLGQAIKQPAEAETTLLSPPQLPACTFAGADLSFQLVTTWSCSTMLSRRLRGRSPSRESSSARPASPEQIRLADRPVVPLQHCLDAVLQSGARLR